MFMVYLDASIKSKVIQPMPKPVFKMTNKNIFAVGLLGIFMLGACSSLTPTGGPKIPRQNRITEFGKHYDEVPTITGEGGLFGGSKSNDGGQGGGIGVNAYLWRATLDTISFMPIASADPFGGVIITDWYAPPESPNERFKLNIYVLGTELRADGIRASVFRQVLDVNNVWRDAQVEADAGRNIEDSVLTRARQIRNAQRAAGN